MPRARRCPHPPRARPTAVLTARAPRAHAVAHPRAARARRCPPPSREAGTSHFFAALNRGVFAPSAAGTPPYCRMFHVKHLFRYRTTLRQLFHVKHCASKPLNLVRPRNPGTPEPRNPSFGSLCAKRGRVFPAPRMTSAIRRFTLPAVLAVSCRFVFSLSPPPPTALAPPHVSASPPRTPPRSPPRLFLAPHLAAARAVCISRTPAPPARTSSRAAPPHPRTSLRVAHTPHPRRTLRAPRPHLRAGKFHAKRIRAGGRFSPCVHVVCKPDRGGLF